MSKQATSNPAQHQAVTAAEALAAFRFVNHLGSLCASGEAAIGATSYAANAGDEIAVVSAGTAIVESAAQLSAGAMLKATTGGKIVLADTEADIVIGRLIDACVTNEFTEVKIVDFKI